MAARHIRLSRSGAPVRVSFEFFPPKTPEMEENLWEAATTARAARPGLRLGHLRGRRLDAGAHPRDGGAHRARDDDEAGRASDLRRRVEAGNSRRRSPPITTRACVISWPCAAIRRAASTRPTRPIPYGYRETAELVADAKRIGDFEVSVGTYPEKHPQSPTLLHDIEVLKRKVDAGADRAITQFFFDNSVYYRFLDVAAAAGIAVPIVPGIFPVQNFKQTANFARRAGTSVPHWLADRFEGLEDDPATRRLVAAAVCAEQVIDLIDHGVEEMHFYTMNRADLVFAICHLIGLRPKPKAAAEAA